MPKDRDDDDVYLTDIYLHSTEQPILLVPATDIDRGLNTEEERIQLGSPL